MLTKYQRESTEQALKETRAALAKELGYRSDLQHTDLVNFYRRHIEKLEWALSL